MRKYLLGTLMLVTTSFVIADGHTPAEKKVLDALETYFEARNNQDWKTVEKLEKNIQLILLLNYLVIITKIYN